MKRIARILFLSFLVYGLTLSQGVRLSTAYNYPLLTGSKADSILNGLKSIRGCTFDPDVEGDGKSEIAVTNYNDNGHVSVFQTVGNDSIQLVWTSPTLTPGGGSTPRYVLFGDLDNDGKKEVIYQLNNVGILVFEWDGVPGSHNFGTSPSQIITTPTLAGIGGNIEYMEITDIDGDGQEELLAAYNSSPNDADRYYVISAVGDWSTNDPGFSSFTVEYEVGRTTLSAKYGIGGGSPVAMIAANLDGTGNKEILIHNWNHKNVVPMRVTGPDTYVLSDTTNGKQNFYIGDLSGTGYDDVALFGGMAYDIDKDGRDEVYLPTYPPSSAGFDASDVNGGTVTMISYDAGQSTAEIDSTNVTLLDLSSLVGRISIFGYGYGDIDRNGKPNLYFTTTYPYNVVSLEYEGGDKKLASSWNASVLYAGEPTIYDSLTVKDSLGTIDTTKYTNTAFASKIYAHATDFDKDGFEDILLPYQAYNDSMSIRTMTWNASTSSYTDTVTTVVNPKRWGFRIIEGTIATGVQVKDLTIIVPNDYRLEQNYPNPFNPSTTIRFRLPVRDRVSLKVFDVLGKEVRTLVDNQPYSAGEAEVVWDGKSNSGVQVASGTYFYTLFFGNFHKTQKMVLLK
jgi:hypothetical protein